MNTIPKMSIWMKVAVSGILNVFVITCVQNLPIKYFLLITSSKAHV